MPQADSAARCPVLPFLQSSLKTLKLPPGLFLKGIAGGCVGRGTCQTALAHEPLFDGVQPQSLPLRRRCRITPQGKEHEREQTDDYYTHDRGSSEGTTVS